MMRPALSPAAAGLLRGLMARVGPDRNRTYLTDFRSVDWQSLTFTGERHEITLRVGGPDSEELVARLTDGLVDAEWAIPGHLVADVALQRPPLASRDGSTIVHLEALTLAD
ncbi:hypothetical protein ABDK56_03515 [Sphingomonas sp. ASV193]|uniref:hypothetical protein n=1 Tax=Sphingomonas sp. ASV193 TaxID=3144405 RepID=UPI0032E8D2CC